MRKLFEDPAMRIQGIKILFLISLLGLPLAYHEAQAEKDALEPAPLTVAQASKPKKEKKEKKKKKKKAIEIEPQNSLTREEGRKLIHEKFTVPPALQDAVDFWKMVYTQYDRTWEIFHDTENLKIVYSILDFSDLYENSALTEEERRALRKARIDVEKERIRFILKRLAEGNYQVQDLTPEEKKIHDLFKADPNPDKFGAAADSRIRSQTGIKDKFVNGIANSGAYLEEIEDIFVSHNLPVELTRMIFIESMFNYYARSKVGASGLWQFMPSTGRLYLNIDSISDERNDPLRASHAAARLLKSNYEALGTWPLAINAYNSGRGTMQKAVSSTGSTNIEEIIRFYRGGVYGFASRNFYPCFLAALEVANHYPKYFGNISKKPPVRYEEYYLNRPVFFGELASAAGINYSELMELNPHLSETILSDGKKIPAGYSLRIPLGANAKCAQAESTLAEASVER